MPAPGDVVVDMQPGGPDNAPKPRSGREALRGQEAQTVTAPCTVTRFRVVTVFDIASTDGDPLPAHPCQAIATSSECGHRLLPRLLDVARGEGITVRQAAPGLGAAHGACVTAEHAIALVSGMSDDQRAKTLCHELGHALLAHTSPAARRTGGGGLRPPGPGG